MGEESGMTIAMRVVASTGSVQNGADELLSGVEGIGEDEAFRVAMVAMSKLIETAPVQFQGSTAHVCAYHNFQNISKAAMARGDLSTALRAQKEIATMLVNLQ